MLQRWCCKETIVISMNFEWKIKFIAKIVPIQMIHSFSYLLSIQNRQLNGYWYYLYHTTFNRWRLINFIMWLNCCMLLSEWLKWCDKMIGSLPEVHFLIHFDSSISFFFLFFYTIFPVGCKPWTHHQNYRHDHDHAHHHWTTRRRWSENWSSKPK